MTTAPEYLGPYRVTGEIGRGGMGAVYRGEHARSSEPVALKLIANAVADQPRFRRRFANEIETLKKLDHPNIARLLGYGEEDGRLFYAMELVEGVSLQDHQRRVGKIPWQDVLDWGIDVCSALKHAHDLGVIHRDLKPANLLIAPNRHLKLTDFGIAKLFGAEEATVAGSVLGTADYMAPEQASGQGVTGRSDLYALGSVMYAMLAGRAPFSGGSVTQVIARLQSATPAPLDLICPDAPPELVELIHELLAKDPTERPPTALVVGNRLRSMREGFKRRAATGPPVAPLSGTQLADAAVASSSPVPAAGAARPFGIPPSDSEGTDPSATLISAAAPQRDGIHSAMTAPPEAMSAPAMETPAPPAGTHFVSVGAEDRRRAATKLTAAGPPARNWQHLFSTLGLVALLLAALAGIIWMIWPPTADQLFADVQASMARPDQAGVETAAADFLRRFADDPRAADVRLWQSQADDAKALRKLKARMRSSIDDRSSTPAADALIGILELETTQPYRAQQRLDGWFAVYGAADSPAAADESLVRMAEQARQRLLEIPSINASPQAKALEAVIGWARQKPASESRRLLSELVELHADAPWAQSLLDPLRRELGAN